MDNQKKNILLVHNYYQVPGGEDTVVANEKKLLEKHGHRVVFYSRHNTELKKMGVIGKLLLPINTIFNFKTFKDIRKLIKKNKIDIVHVHNTLNMVSPSVYYAADSCKVPVFQTIHNFRLLCPGATFYRDGYICEDCIEKGLGCAVKNKCYRNSKIQTIACVLSLQFHRMMGIYKKINYICLTEFNKKKILNLKQIRPERVFVKPNYAVDDGIFIPARRRQRQFVYAGRLDKLKGIEVLLEAWRQKGTSAPKLVIYGTGPMEEWCHKFVTENQLTNVRILGFHPITEIRKVIANSRGVILPTQWYEGFPMSIVEAFSVGTPVVTSDLGNAGSIVEEGVTGAKFRHDSPQELMEAVERLQSYRNICEHTKKEYLQKYSPDSNYKELDRIYQNGGST